MGSLETANAERKNASKEKKKGGDSHLSKYFLVVLVLFSSLSLVINNKFVHDIHKLSANNVVKKRLKEFKASKMQQKIDLDKNIGDDANGDNAENVDAEGDDANGDNAEGDDAKGEDADGDNAEGDDAKGEDANGDNAEGDDAKGEGAEGDNAEGDDAEGEDANGDNAEGDDANGDDAQGNENKEVSGEEGEEEDSKGKPLDSSNAEGGNKRLKVNHTIANLSCEAYGGPSPEYSEEMVYWEDIPKDALHLSPFHPNHNKRQGGTKPITQFLTFEPDEGGWNNIRMAMETVLTLAFAMGRTLVLPPDQGMYLIDKKNAAQKNKFSFDHFFHMESISNEHIGLDIITTKQFLEQCAQGKIVDAENNPIYPPGMRIDWDGAPHNELKDLKRWLREHSGQNLLHWDPEHCIAAFPASSSEVDVKNLASLPDEIKQSPGGFPHYEEYIGKPPKVDAPPIERLKEMSADRTHLCEYTPELQKTQWLHFPVGMTTENGDRSRLLVHFYTFLFFQDWKEDLWMKRFVRDHVRYIDEIQCAAARVVAAVRKRVSERTNGASTSFDTIHIRRGDFQFKETRMEASEILKQLKRVLDNDTTLYIATDERDKSFFNDIVAFYPDVVFLDDMMKELGDINTNYYGMIDQLVSSRGKTFFGCWFSTFTGYINRLRGYHTDDHELPGYEKGAINSYYYAVPDRFDHMREYWPIKKQFYAREFPTSWRLIDSSISSSPQKLEFKTE